MLSTTTDDSGRISSAMSALDTATTGLTIEMVRAEEQVSAVTTARFAAHAPKRRATSAHAEIPVRFVVALPSSRVFHSTTEAANAAKACAGQPQ